MLISHKAVTKERQCCLSVAHFWIWSQVHHSSFIYFSTFQCTLWTTSITLSTWRPTHCNHWNGTRFHSIYVCPIHRHCLISVDIWVVFVRVCKSSLDILFDQQIHPRHLFGKTPSLCGLVLLSKTLIHIAVLQWCCFWIFWSLCVYRALMITICSLVLYILPWLLTVVWIFLRLMLSYFQGIHIFFYFLEVQFLDGYRVFCFSIAFHNLRFLCFDV